MRFFLLFIIVLSFGCRPNSSEKTTQHRLIYNNDGTEILGNNWFGKRPLTLSDVNQYVDLVANSQVTTFMMCSGSDFLYYRSKYGRIIGDDLNGTLKCGENEAFFNVLNQLYRNAVALEKEGTDIVEAALKRAREKKLEAFISFRMNDLHFADTTSNCPVQYADFWRANPHLWTRDTTLTGWNSHNALDFAHPEVRAHKLNIIREQLEKYGALIDGYELDFMRFIVYFRKDDAEKNAPLINAMVEEVRNLTDSIGKVHHKKIMLTVRVPATMDDCRKKGLDVKQWAASGLVDFVTMGVHWRGEPAMSVADFKRELGADIPVYATMDDGGYDPREVYSHGMYRGMASHALGQGAAGMYLFNYFLTVYNESGKQIKPDSGTVVCRTIAPELLKELGAQETLRKRNKIYCLSDGATSYGLTPNSPLPLEVSTAGEFSIFVGDDVKADIPEEVVLFVRTKTNAPFAVSINGHAVTQTQPEYPALFDKLRGIKEEQQVIAFIVPADKIVKGDNVLRFSAEGESTTIQRVELALKYGDVEEYGYF